MSPSPLAAYKPADDVTLNLNELGDVRALNPLTIAQAIIRASEQGARTVDCRLGDPGEYWKNWTHHGKFDPVDMALNQMGYDRLFETNSTADGRRYLLKKLASEL